MTTAALPTMLLQHGPLLVLGVTVAARIGLPAPAAALLMATGALAAAGRFSMACLVMLIALSVLANLIGDGVWFWAGRRHGDRVLRMLCRGKAADGQCRERGASTMRRWGAASLLAAKFVPGVSAVAPPMAGAMGMSLRRFVIAESVSALVWTLFFMGLGAMFGKEVEMLLQWISGLDTTTVASVIVAMALAGALVWSWSRYRRAHPDGGMLAP
ncbi:DedA family protein [Xylophilus sp. GOD-11R]|uniref:DedA family protein n=1 Tax=Xylophilus sp. GOD-11R TaxID=3089814 RepID=UPI00298CCD02|nr:DedA family protein [Xylophilus sp. GOD-11R]WPB56413.1 DedA family protein [Xylophilus sp. GOD-11R]